MEQAVPGGEVWQGRLALVYRLGTNTETLTLDLKLSDMISQKKLFCDSCEQQLAMEFY